MSPAGILLDRSLAQVSIVAFDSLVLDVAGASMTDGTPVLFWDNMRYPNQLWVVRPAGVTGLADAVHLVNALTGRVLDVSGDPAPDKARGAGCCQWPVTDRLNQLWRIVARPDNAEREAKGQPPLVVIQSLIDAQTRSEGDPRLVLDKRFGSNDPILWTAHGGVNQSYELRPAA